MLNLFNTFTGEIIIQRLNWQKVVIFPPPVEGVKVKALAWQPGEAVIAAGARYIWKQFNSKSFNKYISIVLFFFCIGYSNGKVSLLDIEKEDEIYTFTCESDIKTLNWTKTNILPKIDKKDIDYSTVGSFERSGIYPV